MERSRVLIQKVQEMFETISACLKVREQLHLSVNTVYKRLITSQMRPRAKFFGM